MREGDGDPGDANEKGQTLLRAGLMNYLVGVTRFELMTPSV